MILKHNIFDGARHLEVAGAPEVLDAWLIAGSLADRTDTRVLYVARDDARMAAMAEGIRFFSPDLEVLQFPAWDCLPYDRVSPNPAVVGRRLDTLAALAAAQSPESPSAPTGPPTVVLTTVSAILQRVPTRESMSGGRFEIVRGERLDQDALIGFLVDNGYTRSETVREAGEYAVRGGLIDLFPQGTTAPARLDLFGDELDEIRLFDPMSQRSADTVPALVLGPVSEIRLDEESITRFRSGYRAAFGAAKAEDPLYQAVSDGRRAIGMEHWLPLFHDRLERLTDYLPDAVVVLDHQCEDAVAARLDQIAEYYQARRDIPGGGAEGAGRAGDGEAIAPPIYNPLPPDRLYLAPEEWRSLLDERRVRRLSPFAAPEDGDRRIDAGGTRAVDFAEARAHPEHNLFDAVRETIDRQRSAGRRVVVAAYSAGSRERLRGVLAEHGIAPIGPAETWTDVMRSPADTVSLVVLGAEHGFRTDNLLLYTEQDILGDRIIRAAARQRRPEDYIAEASTLNEGDILVHVDHGIGRFEGLETLQVTGAPHDCLRLIYDGGDKLYVPVENVEMLSRYGSEDAGVQLDRLGGAGWQARKARAKKRIKDIAEALIRIAAERELAAGTAMVPAEGMYDEFAARFPFPETEDQSRAIHETLDDLSSGRPMDRLICGDVGFGKTEIALRAAFVAAMEGYQVAVIVPTTLLCRQHFLTFSERFAGLPIRLAQLSRLVGAKDAAAARAGIADGGVDIVIGTHALLGQKIEFKRLGLLVVDEEQHFGVAQKERLKKLKADVHVLTLTATPIPRTLQLALSGVRKMSLVATPPVDRLAVRTFVLPYDPVVVREAIMRERFRGGQTFYVCPRIENLAGVADQLMRLIPDLKLVTVHGQMPARQLEDSVAAFYDRRYELLLCTNIIESGLDLPAVNTMIIHRADMFGLATLYQLRGRVGRSKLRAYTYLTLPNHRVLNPNAYRRLEVMQTLDSLGAGFSLASHDMDIRGAGNLLGEEQSGHIREVGIELYQHMLEEAVALARSDGAAGVEAESWTPQINIGLPVLIPDAYVTDLGLRLSLYRRISGLVDEAEIDAFAAEIIDRFGPLPPEVDNLLRIVGVKQLCRSAGVEKVDAGPKGAVLTFRGDQFANPAGLVGFITGQRGKVQLRPDHKLVYRRDWTDAGKRLDGLRHLLRQIAEIAEKEAA